MSWWVYKNNSTNHTTERLHGDWHDFFDANRIEEWGYTCDVPALARITVGDHILCYQSNLNELVGVARAHDWQTKHGNRFVRLEPLYRLEVRMRPLKRSHPAVARIRAFQPGPILTISTISPTEVAALLTACGRDVSSRVPTSKEAPLIDIDTSFVDGAQRAARSRSRNPRLIRRAKQYYGAQCYCCGFDFDTFYAGRVRGLCVVHHLKEFRGTRSRRRTRVADVRVVCGNCHLALHAEQPAMSVETLRHIVRRRRLLSTVP